MTRLPPEDRDSSHQPTEHPPALGSIERILDGFGFGLLPDAAAILFPTAFGEDRHPRAAAPPTPGVPRRSGRRLDRVIRYAIRHGRAWLYRSCHRR